MARKPADGTLLAVKVQPGASADALTGIEPHALALTLKVRARAHDGAANEAVIRLLAEQLDVPKSRLSITRGTTSRNKTLHVELDAATLEERLNTLVHSHHHKART